MKKEQVNPKQFARIEDQLDADEEVLWVGRPASAQTVLRSGKRWILEAFLTIFGWVPILAIVFHFIFVDPMGKGSVLSTLIMVLIVFIFVNIAVIATVFMFPVNSRLTKALNIRRTLYTVTDRRIFIKIGRTVTPYEEEDIEFLQRNQHVDLDSGDLIFRREYHIVVGESKDSGTRFEVPIGFFGINHVRQVEALMLETFRPEVSEYFDIGRSKEEDADGYEANEANEDSDQAQHLHNQSPFYEKREKG